MKRAQYLFPDLIPDIEKWPIYQLHSRRELFVKDLTDETVRRLLENRRIEGLKDSIAHTIYKERIRMKESPWRVDPGDEQVFWKQISMRLVATDNSINASNYAEEITTILRTIVHRYAEEIVGTFNKKTFLFARRFLTAFFKWLLNAAAPKGRLFWGTRRQLYEKLIVRGPLEEIRQLARDHILVVVPTHFSNLDSILVGYAMDAVLGLPSFSYGAGLNLYNFGPAAYYMNRLGAYRVDRRKKNQIYLETLKTMSCLSIEQGTNTLFFPGGTRSRSGSMETQLKLGLLGTTVEAQRALLEKGDTRKVIIVPLVIGYNFVLEAKSLIENHLRRTGREQYIRTRDYGSSIRQIIKFTWQFFSATSDITLSFGQPVDVIGNPVDANGHSHDKDGRMISLREFFFFGDSVTPDLQRESEFTRTLSQKIIELYRRENTVLSSHLVAYVAFHVLKDQHPGLDLFALLRLPTEDLKLRLQEFIGEVRHYQQVLLEMERDGKVRLAPEITGDAEALVRDGLKKLGTYHDRKPLLLNKSGEVLSHDFKLLYYYHNRLEGYHLVDRVHTMMTMGEEAGF